MKRLQTAIKGFACYLYGSILFWLPDALWHLWRRGSFAGIDCIILTNVLPVIVAVGVLALMWLTGGRLSRMLISVATILGILTTGPACMMVNASFSGGTYFAQGVPWRTLGILTLGFWLSDVDLSTYDGTLFALAISVAVLIILPTCYKRAKLARPETHSGALRTDQ